MQCAMHPRSHLSELVESRRALSSGRNPEFCSGSEWLGRPLHKCLQVCRDHIPSLLAVVGLEIAFYQKTDLDCIRDFFVYIGVARNTVKELKHLGQKSKVALTDCLATEFIDCIKGKMNPGQLIESDVQVGKYCADECPHLCIAELTYDDTLAIRWFHFCWGGLTCSR